MYCSPKDILTYSNINLYLVSELLKKTAMHVSDLESINISLGGQNTNGVYYQVASNDPSGHSSFNAAQNAGKNHPMQDAHSVSSTQQPTTSSKNSRGKGSSKNVTYNMPIVQ